MKKCACGVKIRERDTACPAKECKRQLSRARFREWYKRNKNTLIPKQLVHYHSTKILKIKDRQCRDCGAVLKISQGGIMRCGPFQDKTSCAAKYRNKLALTNYYKRKLLHKNPILVFVGIESITIDRKKELQTLSLS